MRSECLPAEAVLSLDVGRDDGARGEGAPARGWVPAVIYPGTKGRSASGMVATRSEKFRLEKPRGK